MIRNVDVEHVADILSKIETRLYDEDQLKLGLVPEVHASDYYEALDTVVETLNCVAAIFAKLPEDVVSAANMRLYIGYSDDVIEGSIVIKGGTSACEAEEG